jgi:signal transduction histidine kinase
VFQSLRFRLPALFLAGIALAAAVSTAIAVQLFQDHIRDQTLDELKREAIGLTQLYAKQAVRSSDEGRSAPEFQAAQLEKATGDRLFYVGVSLFPGQKSGLRQLRRSIVDWPALQEGKIVTFEFQPPGENRTFLAVAHPLRFEHTDVTVGALVVAKPKTALRSAWLTLIKLLAVAFGVGILVAGLLAAYLSRRIAGPVLGLSRAADEIAKGHYDVDVPAVPGGGEIQHLAERFGEMAVRLAEADAQERNFLMSVSHELRTPLTAIRGHVDALREGVVADRDAQQESLAVIAKEAGRLERLVGDVLDLAKLDANRFTLLHEEVDMGRLLDQAYAAFGEEARRRGIDYRCDTDGDAVILSDGDRVLQIISNLLSNAFRWTPDGGRIELALEAQNGKVAVSVADTGPGIKPEERERIFRPFWSRDGGGTGLGLAIARELAMALGGRIDLQSAPGQGSRFQLVLPAGPA